ncbi:MAG: hypothetical protein HQM10_23195 [Candidatus Riflebacteria bacterium]|nr:hypothetical protein [Candidatus Riflebacteria bacterium]
MKIRNTQKRFGFSMMLVLAVMLTFAALYPLVFIQSDYGLKKLKNVGVASQIYWAAVSESQRANSEAIKLFYEIPPVTSPFTLIATYTLPQINYRDATFTVQIKTEVTLNPARSDEWQATQTLNILENGAATNFASAPHKSVASYVTPEIAFEALTSSVIEVKFSREMPSSVLNIYNYRISGIGTGTLAVNPSSITATTDPTDPLAEHIFQLSWASGAGVSAESITVSVNNIVDLSGNPVYFQTVFP